MKKVIKNFMKPLKYIMLLTALHGILFAFGKTDAVITGFILIAVLLTIVAAGMILNLINNAGS